MGTEGGAAAVGASQELGQVEVGMLADLCLLNIESAAYVPLNEPVQNIVFSEYGQSVWTVLVGGEIVVDEGRVVTVSESEIYGLAREAASRFFTDNREAFARLREFTPAFERAYARAALVDYPTNRWIPGE
jgi:formylmethanofuran dehydrogenase subunit A